MLNNSNRPEVVGKAQNEQQKTWVKEVAAVGVLESFSAEFQDCRAQVAPRVGISERRRRQVKAFICRQEND